MIRTALTDALWGKQSKLTYLLFFTTLLLFSFLGAREIWTQEHRWADIVSGMFYRHDFLHPYLGEHSYYDKPLLSYWLIVLVSKIIGSFNTWALRLPSASAGLLAVFSIYWLGRQIKDKQVGLLAGWLLTTTFYFLFWSRVSSADMLNLAGSLFAVAWYYAKRSEATFVDYVIFFLILAATSLCKGLGGAIIPLLAVCTDLIIERSFKKHLHFKLILSAIPALLLYLAPFLASAYFGGNSYDENGLYLVYRENILRFFHPFDHQGGVYTYFIYLPIYLIPWTVLFIPALVGTFYRYKDMSISGRWLLFTNLFIFLFFTLSGSRRSYYILPLVPFTILFIAEWLLAANTKEMYRKWTARGIILFFVLMFVAVDLLPAWYYGQYGMKAFVERIKLEMAEMNWDKQPIVLLDAESKLNFYLQLPPDTKNYELIGDRNQQTSASLIKAWPFLENKASDTIFITRQRYLPLLRPYFSNYRQVTLPPVTQRLSFLHDPDNAPLAFVPKR